MKNGLLALLLASSAVAESGKVVTTLGARISNSEWKTGAYAEGDALGRINDNFYLGMGIGITTANNKVNTLSAGDLMAIPILAKARLEAKGRFKPYLDAGIGYVIFDHSISDDLTNQLSAAAFKLEEDVDPAFGATVGGGVVAQITDAFDLGLNIMGLFTKPKVKAKLTDLTTGRFVAVEDKVNLNSMIIGLQANLRF